MKAPDLNSVMKMDSSAPANDAGVWSPAPESSGKFKEKCFYGLLGVAILLAGWQILSMLLSEVIIASPLATFSSLFSLMLEKSTWSNILITLERLLAGLLIGSLVGIVLGITAGLNSKVRLMMEPLRWVAMTVPAVVIAIVAMLWFGMGTMPVIFVTAIISMPFTYVNILEGITAIDRTIIEMGRAFRLPRRMFFTEVYLPGIGSSLMAALTLTAGMGVRVAVLSELMGAHDGIGHAFSVAWTHLDTPEIFAWVLMSLILLGILEFGILLPIKNSITKWRTHK
jgi:NitT/TauT family transport system permease protein